MTHAMCRIKTVTVSDIKNTEHKRLRVIYRNWFLAFDPFRLMYCN